MRSVSEAGKRSYWKLAFLDFLAHKAIQGSQNIFSSELKTIFHYMKQKWLARIHLFKALRLRPGPWPFRKKFGPPWLPLFWRYKNLNIIAVKYLWPPLKISGSLAVSPRIFFWRRPCSGPKINLNRQFNHFGLFFFGCPARTRNELRPPNLPFP